MNISNTNKFNSNNIFDDIQVLQFNQEIIINHTDLLSSENIGKLVI